MNASLLAVLNDAERLLVAQTGRAELAALDEDAAIELETRVRRARNKYVGQYRRAASAAVARQSAAELRAERIAAARAAKQGQAPGTRRAAPATGPKGATITGEPTGDRALRSPVMAKRRASTRAAGARRQASRDSR